MAQNYATAADMLIELDEALRAEGSSSVSPRMKDPREGQAETLRALHAVRRENFFPTIGQAVNAPPRAVDCRWTGKTTRRRGRT